MVASENTTRRSARLAQASENSEDDFAEVRSHDELPEDGMVVDVVEPNRREVVEEERKAEPDANNMVVTEVLPAILSTLNLLRDHMQSQNLGRRNKDGLKDVLKYTSGFNIAAFKGRKGDYGAFNSFYRQLEEQVLESFGSLKHMEFILHQHLDPALQKKVRSHLGDAPMKGNLETMLSFLRSLYEDGDHRLRQTHIRCLKFHQQKKESVQNMRFRWEELMQLATSQDMPMHPMRQMLHLCDKFNGDIGTLVFREGLDSLDSFWRQADRIYQSSFVTESQKNTGARTGYRQQGNSRRGATVPNSSRKRGRTRNSSSGDSSKDSESSGEKTDNKRKKLSQADRRKYRREGRCFKCHKTGHIASECPDGKDDKNKDSESYSVSSPSLARRQVRLANLKTKGRSNLLELDLQINGITARVLCDGGAEINAISHAFVENHGLPTVDLSAEDIFDVTGAAPGAFQDTCRQKCTNLTISGPKNLNFSKDHFYVTRLSYDLILGKPWLARHNPMIDWRKNLISFKFDTGSTVTWKADGSCRETQINGLRSAKQINSILRRQRAAKRAFMLVIRPVSEESSMDLDGTDFVAEYADVFPDELPKRLPPHRHIEHSIELKSGSKPKFQYPYRMSPKQKAEVEKVVSELLELGYIRPSMSPWGAPVLFAPKSDGTLRFCIDYRQLNKMTVRDRFPIPRTDELIDRLSGMKVFSKIDLWSAYHQMRLTEDSIPMSAFSTHMGHFEWLVLPFGMVNAPASFQSLMQSLFGNLQFVVVYLDDILIFSKSREEHESHIHQVLSILREHKLCAKKKKCSFFQTSIEYLGFVIDQTGLNPNPDKIACVKEWPTPRNVRDVRSFLGLANYYRRFVKGFARIAHPITELLKKESSFTWSHECDSAFNELKHALCTAPVLRLPDLTADFFIETDASDFAIGAVLLQKYNRFKHPVAYISRKMDTAERKYPVQEKELLALLYALKKWRHYLYGTRISAYTDHQSLLLWHSFKNPTGRKARWIMQLSEYNVELFYKPGLQNIVADTLSRRSDYVSLNNISQVQFGEKLLSLIRENYQYDKHFKDIVAYYESGSDVVPKKLSSYVDWFKYRDGLLWDVRKPNKRPRLCVPRNLEILDMIFKEVHSNILSGHLGYAKTLHRMLELFYFPKMHYRIREMLRKCVSCQSAKHSTKASRLPLQPLDVPSEPWESVSMDFIVELPMTERGFDALMVVVDRLTKFCILIPTTTNASARDVAFAFLNNVVCRFGIPKSIVSDRDPKFTSAFWSELHEFLGTDLRLSSAYHPETDGQTERMNQTLEIMVRHYISPDLLTWDLLIERLEMAYNTSKHHSSKYTPYFLNHGREAPLLLDHLISVPHRCEHKDTEDFVDELKLHWKLARDAVRTAQQLQSQWANRTIKIPDFNVGDWVWLSTKYINTLFKARQSHKFQKPYIGPFKILSIRRGTFYELDLPPRLGKLHNVFYGGLLKKYVGEARPYSSSDTEDLHLVEAILNSKGRHPNRSYLVKWVGFDDTHNTWEPESHLRQYVSELIDEFDLRNRDEQRKRSRRQRKSRRRVLSRRQ